MTFVRKCDSGGIASSGWESSIARNNVVPERSQPTTKTNGSMNQLRAGPGLALHPMPSPRFGHRISRPKLATHVLRRETGSATGRSFGFLLASDLVAVDPQAAPTTAGCFP